jgi:hypothetical protein
MSNIILPTSPLPPTRISPKLLFLYGQPKCGKTTVLSQLKDCLIIETDDGGADFVTALKVQVNSLDEFEKVVAEIIKAGKPYKFVAVDTTTQIEEWCIDHATKEYKNSTIGKNFKGDNVLTLPEGAGYQWLRTSFKYFMGKLSQCASHVIATGHIKDKFLGKKLGSDVSALDIDHTGQIKRMICAGADAIGYMFRATLPSPVAGQPEKEILKVSFKTKETINCGTRAQYLAGQEFEFDWRKIYPEEFENKQ